MALPMLTNQMQENMVRAQKRDAVRSEKFYFRKSVVPDDDDDDDANEGAGPKRSHDHEYTEMSVDTIINGKVCPFPYHTLVSISFPWNGLRTSSPVSFLW